MENQWLITLSILLVAHVSVLRSATQSSVILANLRCTYRNDAIKRCFISSEPFPSKVANYWNFNGNLYDSTTNTPLASSSAVSFGRDRFGRSNSAIFFNGYNVSLLNFGNVWFNGELTIGFWEYTVSFNPSVNAKLLSCQSFDSQISLSTNKLNEANLFFEQYATSYHSISSQSPIKLNVWTHKAVVVRSVGGTAYTALTYINGTVSTNAKTGFENDVMIDWTSCLLGSNTLVSYIDDLFFFRVALANSEIINLMNYYF